MNGQEHRVDYLPAESNTGMFGGNSNWRGPVWMPVNALIIRALQNFYLYYGDNFKIECPTGSGKMMNLFEVSKEIGDRLTSTFTRDEQGPAPGLRRHGEVPDRSPLARPHPVLRVLPRRQRRGPRRQPPDRLDRARGQAHRALRAPGSRACTGRGEEGRVRSGRPSNGPRSLKCANRFIHRSTRSTRAVWLTELARSLGRPVTLDDIPDVELDRLAGMGFDWIWLLSVWQTGLAGQRISRANREWRKEFEETLPDLREEDIAGSGFAITGYVVHSALGGDVALARAARAPAQRGLRLMLDFVPNHMGTDHPWIEQHPDYFVHGSETRFDPGAPELRAG